MDISITATYKNQITGDVIEVATFAAEGEDRRPINLDEIIAAHKQIAKELAKKGE